MARATKKRSLQLTEEDILPSTIPIAKRTRYGGIPRANLNLEKLSRASKIQAVTGAPPNKRKRAIPKRTTPKIEPVLPKQLAQKHMWVYYEVEFIIQEQEILPKQEPKVNGEVFNKPEPIYKYYLRWTGDYPDSWEDETNVTQPAIDEWKAWKARQPPGTSLVRHSADKRSDTPQPSPRLPFGAESEVGHSDRHIAKRRRTRKVIESSPEIEPDSIEVEAKGSFKERSGSESGAADPCSGTTIEAIPTQLHSQEAHVLLKANDRRPLTLTTGEVLSVNRSAGSLFVSESSEKSGSPALPGEQHSNSPESGSIPFSARPLGSAGRQEASVDSQAITGTQHIDASAIDAETITSTETSLDPIYEVPSNHERENRLNRKDNSQQRLEISKSTDSSTASQESVSRLQAEAMSSKSHDEQPSAPVHNPTLPSVEASADSTNCTGNGRGASATERPTPFPTNTHHGLPDSSTGHDLAGADINSSALHSSSSVAAVPSQISRILVSAAAGGGPPPRPNTPSTMSTSKDPSQAKPNESDTFGFAEKRKAFQRTYQASQIRISRFDKDKRSSSPSVKDSVPRGAKQPSPTKVSDLSSQSSTKLQTLVGTDGQQSESSRGIQATQTRKGSPVASGGNASSALCSRTPEGLPAATTSFTEPKTVVDVNVPLPLTESAKELYNTEFAYSVELVNSFLERSAQSPDSPSNDSIEFFCHRLFGICFHLDLLDDGRWKQYPSQAESFVSRATSCSAKFQFLYELLEGSRDTEKHIALFMKAGPPTVLIERFLKAMDITCKHRDSCQMGSRRSKITVTIFSTNDKTSLDNLEAIDLVISLDETFNPSNQLLQNLRRSGGRGNYLCPLLTLVTSYSMEHVARTMPATLSAEESLRERIRMAVQLRREAGSIHTSAVRSAKEALKLLMNTSNTGWTLPTLEDLPVDASLKRRDKEMSPSHKRARSYELAGDSENASKRLRWSPRPEQLQPHNSSARISNPIVGPPFSFHERAPRPQSENDPNGVQPDAQNPEPENSGVAIANVSVDASLREKHLQKIVEEQAGEITRFSHQVNELFRNNNQLRAQLADREILQSRLQTSQDARAELKDENKRLKGDIVKARLDLTESNVPELRELATALDSLQRIPILEQSNARKEKDFDYLKEQYQKAQSYGSEQAGLREQLEEEIRALQKRADGEMRMLHETFAKAKDHHLRQEIKRLSTLRDMHQRQLEEARKTIGKLRVEMSALKDSRGMGTSTRSSSVRASSLPVDKDDLGARRPTAVGGRRASAQRAMFEEVNPLTIMRRAICEPRRY